MDRTVIGIVGPMASGKGEVVKKLSELGFKTYSLSDILRETADLLKLPHDRKILQDVGNLLREHAGSAVLAERTAATILVARDRKIAVESIRHPEEVLTFKRIFLAPIIAVDASLEKRFDLMELRGRPGDPKTREEFLIAAERDLGIGQEYHGQQVAACLRLADYTITNGGTLAEFEFKIDDLFARMGIEGQKFYKEKHV